MVMRPNTPAAYSFFCEGTVALAEVEHNGIEINVDYLHDAMNQVRAEINKKVEVLKGDEVYEIWRKRFANPNIDSPQQLGEVLFNQMGFKVKEKTATGQAKTDERALEGVNHPFVKNFLEMKKLKRVLTTYLYGIERETVNGRLHPSYNLAGGLDDDQKGGARSYRGSSSDPNFQNMPIRNKVMGKIIRDCFIARPGYRLAEIDFATIEVRIAACVTKDPVLIDYVKNSPPKDMHTDTACELFMLKPDQIEKKGPRDAAKNKFVFPQFYGDYYVSCTKAIWEMMERQEYKIKDTNVLVKDHLAKKGITRRGKCDPEKPPVPGTFEYQVKSVEDLFWNKWFKHYTAWKRKFYDLYRRTGEVYMPTGFTASGCYRRNQVLNLPIQGPAFHCLLFTIIELSKHFRRLKLKSKIVGQIHDCILIEIHESEINTVLDLAEQVMTVDLPKAWKWIIVPLGTEVDIVPEGGTWNEKSQWVRSSSGGWASKS